MRTLVISDELHKILKNQSKKKKVKLSNYVEQILTDHVNFSLEEKSLLPQILKDSKNEIIQTLICNYIGSEMKNNMPKEITLMRTTNDSGYIGNYILK